ncbi:hypothetical protein J1C67_14610 [Clostridium gasigenes]|uniref:hypothetical protein n=1 Tax=Clostridium gasigenes TaxID=94869 RepID=UPI00143841FA|nr:hypothetical protein [Clostridium gasigenes]NKF05315.1 hypothetical protein [Clostridium gasigenes]QSW18768.1 hypothetical protein J1C67_14610 [Clostridium gasigenes]
MNKKINSLLFLNIIRKIRNKSGHSTGIIINSNELQTIFSQYHLLYNDIHNLISNLKEK